MVHSKGQRGVENQEGRWDMGWGLGEGHSFAAPVVVLHLDGEWDQFGVPLGAEGGELVDAGPLEVVSQPIEGGVVRVTRPNARQVLHDLAPWGAIDHRTLLMASNVVGTLMGLLLTLEKRRRLVEHLRVQNPISWWIYGLKPAFSWIPTQKWPRFGWRHL
uniref:Uncharacterized protein n=1 Tax=Amazona collaria TaxID=241587 RepID=A0A8B9FEM4_9PSIT